MEEKKIEPSPKSISSEVVVPPEKPASEKEDQSSRPQKKVEEEALDDGRFSYLP